MRENTPPRIQDIEEDDTDDYLVADDEEFEEGIQNILSQFNTNYFIIH